MKNGTNTAMSDRTSAEIFSKIFGLLADYKAANPTPTSFSVLVKDVVSLTDDYDFSQRQMYCDRALKNLGIEVEEEVVDEYERADNYRDEDD